MLFRSLWISASLLVSSFALAAPTPTSSVSSSSASSKACPDVPGFIFKNCVDGSFPGLHALEVTKDLYYFFDITDGTAGNVVNWAIISSPGRKKAIDVQFKTGTNFYGLFNVIPKTGTEDLSAYAKGALEFDVRILDRGVYNVPLEVKLECVYPCQSKEHVLDIPTLNQWTSISLPIADFVAEGLDLTKVNIPFQIFPAWGSQDGVHFQVDNIRWVKRATRTSSSQASSIGGAVSSKSSSSKASSASSKASSGNSSSKLTSSAKSSAASSAKSASSKSSAKSSSVKSSAKSSAVATSVKSSSKSSQSSVKSSAKSSVKSSSSKSFSSASSVKSSAVSSKFSSASSLSSLASSKSSVAASSQSSAAILSCAYQEGGVYFDATCSPWQNISAYEQNGDGSINQEVTNGVGYSVNLSEVSSTDANHNKVLDIHYNRNPDFNGTVRLRSIDITGVDLSAYATGKLVFDIKVITNSDDNGDIEMALDCGWPCTNTERIIKVPALNQWTTIELSVADLIRDGLDIKHLLGGFQIATSWGHQANSHFQLDNIRWVKGTGAITTKDCWAQRFNTYDPLNLRIDQFSGSSDMSALISQIVPNTILHPIWEGLNKWGYAAGTDANLAACNTNGTLSASVYIPATYVNDGHLAVSFYAVDQGGGQTFSQPISVANLKGNDWNTITSDLWFFSSITAPGFNIGAVAFIGVVFDANGKDPAIGGVLKVDNLLITQPIQ